VIEELGYYDSRIKELKEFRRIGRAQLTDVLTAQSQQSSLRASMLQIQGQLRAERAVLAFLTGFSIDVPLVRPSAEGKSAKPLERYLARLEHRPDVQGDSARAKASDSNITVARSGHFPSLSFQADYYLERTGALQNVSWDAMLLLTVPIFAGGIVQSQVEQAVSKRDQAELQVSQTRRLAEQQIRQFYESYVGDKNQFEGYREAADLAEKNYREELRTYRLGLVTNLDVLTALTTFIESKRSFDKARYSMLQDIENLEAAGAFKPGPVPTGSK
jgi:outer membrane protein